MITYKKLIINKLGNECRHCLWILGNETTLINSDCDSIWRKLVLDAKERECFHNADEDPKLAEVIEDTLLEIELLDESESPFKNLSLQDRSERTGRATTSR